ncbi:YesL family protein [Bifidobacterium mongoliense]|uniref:YesL family protein n=1 Tax=Bifidobacterium mongoliense TaxID=518643 RepID=UPI0030EE0748
MKRFAMGYEYFARIIMMILIVHIAVIVHTLLGLVVCGFFPSLAASNTTYRTWLLEVEDRSWTVKHTWTVFHRAWKQELGPANAFGWPQFAVWALLIWEYWLTMTNNMGTFGIVVSGVLLVLNLLYGLFVFMSWAVRSNFDEGFVWVLRTSLTMVIARPPVLAHGVRPLPHHRLGLLHLAGVDGRLRCLRAGVRHDDGRVLLGQAARHGRARDRADGTRSAPPRRGPGLTPFIGDAYTGGL